MIKINLPKRLETKLRESQELEGIVMSTISRFGDILIDNKLYFFEEYTDHGVQHIEAILASTSNIITEECLVKILTAKDIAMYILAVILHDIAMHLSTDGFNQLLSGMFDDVRTEGFDKLSWKQLWNEYINEAKRFNRKQLVKIFGREDIIIRVPPLDNPGRINGEDKKLIGEFIRRYHTRLAHEIALKGFPGKDNQQLDFSSDLDQRHKDMIGLIARSHGLELRTCIDHLESEYGKITRRHINGIHIVYLFTLLRISDYLQIDRNRTSGTLLKLKTLSSPVSQMEHDAHLSIDYIDDRYQNDPERIYVHASPQNSSMYLKLQKLFKDIQYELDICWAVLGEVYGNLNEKPEIKFRRITSNLEDRLFRDKQTYATDSFYFKANNEIVKLLIAPLYGNDPKYGIRELLQNAVDSCKERELIEGSKLRNYTSAVDIDIYRDKQETPYFTIRDNGIGMPLNVIKNYFLTAGASFRQSSDWQKLFLDTEGNSKITRSGQFGVGVLAAFLIGKEICVETRNYNEKFGYKFSANLDLEQIEIIKDANIETGTFIRIKIDEEKLDLFEKKPEKYYPRNYELPKFEWAEWFMLNKPQVRYNYFGDEIISLLKKGPDLHDVSPEWRSIEPKGYHKIFWTYDDSYGERRRDFICNGIVIPEAFSYESGFNTHPFVNPKIAVYDNNALLPLTLDRDALASDVTFENDLIEDIFKDFLSFVLLSNTSTLVTNSKVTLQTQTFKYPGTLSTIMDTYLISKEGFILQTQYTFDKLKQINLIEIDSLNISSTNKTADLDIKSSFLKFTLSEDYSLTTYPYRFENNPYNNNYTPRKEKWLNNAKVFLKATKYKELFEGSKKRVPDWIKKRATKESTIHGFKSMELGKPTENIITESFLKKYEEKIIFIKEHLITKMSYTTSAIDRLLERYLEDNVIIPYSIEERKKLYPLAFKELSEHMKRYI